MCRSSRVKSKKSKMEIFVSFCLFLIIVFCISIYAKTKIEYKEVLFISILLYTFSYYGAQIIGITVFTYTVSEIPWSQRIGPTTLVVFAILLSMLSKKLIKRPISKFGRKLEILLWLYCSTMTFSQFFSHSFFSAIGLSIGAGWQFLAVFYVFISLIECEKDLLALINAMMAFSFINFIFMVIAKGPEYFKSLSTVYNDVEIREGAVGALGPPVSAAVYLAILISLGVGMYLYKKNKIYLGSILLNVFLLLNTFTRGGIFILALLGLLLFIPEFRKILLGKIVLILLFSIPLWGKIWEYISYRGITIDISQEANFVIRLLLIYTFFKDFYIFSLIGNGILNPTLMQVNDWISLPLHNTYLGILDECGIFPFIIFSYFSLIIVIKAYRIISHKKNNITGSIYFLLPFIFISILQWILFANTTSTSILYFYPYEGTLFFWLLCFSPVIIFKLLQNKLSINSIQVNTHV